MIIHKNARTRLVTARIGKGRVVHAMWRQDAVEGLVNLLDGTTECRVNQNDWTSSNAVEVEADEITCKKCLRALAIAVENAHAKAITEDQERTLTAMNEAAVAEATPEATQADPQPIVALYSPDGTMFLVAGSSESISGALWLTDTRTFRTDAYGPAFVRECLTALPEKLIQGNQVDLPEPPAIGHYGRPYTVGDRVVHKQTGVRGRVTFVGVRGEVLHVKPEGGAPEIIGLRAAFQFGSSW